MKAKIIVNLGLCISVYDMRSIDGIGLSFLGMVCFCSCQKFGFIHYLSCSLIQVHFKQSFFFFFFIDVWFHSLSWKWE